MTTLALGLSLLMGCSANKIKVNLDPSEPYSRLNIPTNPTRMELAAIIVECVADRELLYSDFDDIKRTETQLTKRWYQFWK